MSSASILLFAEGSGARRRAPRSAFVGSSCETFLVIFLDLGRRPQLHDETAGEVTEDTFLVIAIRKEFGLLLGGKRANDMEAAICIRQP